MQHLLDNGGIGMNELARLPFPQEDREQFAQLIGYSICGFHELSYVSETLHAAVDALDTDPGSNSVEAERDAAVSALQDLRVACARLRQTCSEFIQTTAKDRQSMTDALRYWVVWNDDGTHSVIASSTMPPRVGPYHAKRRGSATPEEARSLADGMDRVNRRRIQKQRAKRQAAQDQEGI